MPRVLDRSKILPEVRRNSLDLRSPRSDVRVGILRFYMDTSRFAVWTALQPYLSVLSESRDKDSPSAIT